MDRLDVLDLAEEYLMPYGTVNSLVVDGDVMIVTMSGMDLEQISAAMFQRLSSSPSSDPPPSPLPPRPRPAPAASWTSPSPSPFQSDDAETEAAQ